MVLVARLGSRAWSPRNGDRATLFFSSGGRQLSVMESGGFSGQVTGWSRLQSDDNQLIIGRIGGD
jgi:hypothetical protein